MGICKPIKLYKCDFYPSCIHVWLWLPITTSLSLFLGTGIFSGLLCKCFCMFSLWEHLCAPRTFNICTIVCVILHQSWPCEVYRPLKIQFFTPLISKTRKTLWCCCFSFPVCSNSPAPGERSFSRASIKSCPRSQERRGGRGRGSSRGWSWNWWREEGEGRRWLAVRMGHVQHQQHGRTPSQLWL